jgi:signal transduction histidine kinase
MFVSIYLALSQRINVESDDFLTPIIAVLSAISAYIFLSSKTPPEPINKQCEHQKDQLLQQMSGSVAHDFNNVMSVVMGNAEMLKESLSQSENSTLFIDAILEAVQKGINLTQNLLSFSQKQFLQPVNIDVNQFVFDYITDINLPLYEKNKIHFKATEDLCIARLDPSFFEECLLQLIQNAIKANSNYIKIEISNNIDIANVDNTLIDTISYLSIMISDDGVGISDQNLKHIYQPYFTTRKTDATKGLGLSAVWGFCQQSGGSIYVQSKLEKGTTFKIIIPAVQSEK